MTPPGEGLRSGFDPKNQSWVRVARSKMARILTLKFGPFFLHFQVARICAIKHELNFFALFSQKCCSELRNSFVGLKEVL